MHQHAALILVLLVLVVAFSRIHHAPETRPPRPPCRHPIAVRLPGQRSHVVCGQRAAMSALARALPRCGALPRPRSGQRVVVDNADACRLRFARMSGAELLTLGVPLDLNTAPETALRALPGIGPVLAARIVADRRRRGVYPSVDALQRVRGIGEKTVARLRGLVSVTAGASER